MRHEPHRYASPFHTKTAWPSRAAVTDRVTVVENWDAVFRSPSVMMPVPKVVALREYHPVSGLPKFCRRSIMIRDRFTCQYCGKRFPSQDLTFDHVVPRSEGGQTVWTNILTACLQCNGIKGSKPANYSGRRGVISANGRLRPLKEPRRPTSTELLRGAIEMEPDQVSADFASWIYWTTELDA